LPYSTAVEPLGFVLPGTASGKVINTTGTTAPTSYYATSFPSSNHSGGVMATFCDGHVKYIADSAPAAVLSQLMTSKASAATAAYQSLPPPSDGEF
jgi:prepilin-type processing-associated H-X9-DG protein